MSEAPEMTSTDAAEVFAAGRRHLAVKDYNTAVSTLARACELLAVKHGEQADQCADAYLWYGKALLGLSREESGVLGHRVPQGEGDVDKDSDEEENGEESESGENGEAEADEDKSADKDANSVEKNAKSEDKDAKHEERKTDDAQEAGSSKDVEPGQSNGEVNGDESAIDFDEDDVDNLQLAWETLDLARSIFEKRVSSGGGDAARALLADVYLTLGEVALESETYDKAVLDMQNCLDIQKELYSNDDRRIAETHYQIALANSLSSNFEEAITHFKNAANILETRIKTLENPSSADDATVKKYTTADPFYSVAGEIKELKDLLPEIHEKIQDMIDYKAETVKRLREQLCGSTGPGSSNGQASSNGQGSSNGSGGSGPPKQASDISHLIRRKRKPSEEEETPAKNMKS